MREVADDVYESDVEASHGDDYVFVVDGVELPDPRSRWQPQGLRGPSRVLDPSRFAWTDGGFRAPSLQELALYELHIGTFSREGTFDSAIAHLPELRDLGVNAVEVMPIAEFPGRHGWGYDGVYISAAHSAYGGPDSFQRFVDAAHAHGLAVVLDVVYNHLGASGVKAMEAFGPYFTDKYETFWGKAVNFDDEGSEHVREWVLESAESWIRDFHVDGLRIDAVHAIFDDSPEHIVAAIARRVHAAGGLVIAESALDDPAVVTTWGCDAQWADNFHHALHTLLTGEREGYYAEFGRLSQLAEVFRTPYAGAEGLPPERFVVCLQNHDQVGNRAFGDRLPREVQPLAALCMLLAPFTPMLWQGEEYGERAPFQFFCDHIDEEIATATREGRRREFEAFAAFAGQHVPDPQDPQTFARSKLTRERDDEVAALYRQLLRVRPELPRGPVEAVEHDEQERWLHVGRGPFTLVANFDREREHRAPAGELVVGTGARLDGGDVVLGPLGGALIR